MNIQINAIGAQGATNEVLSQFNNKLQKLGLLFDRVLSIEVWLKEVRHEKVIEVKVRLPRQSPIFVKKTGKELKTVFDQIMDSITNAVKNKKEKTIENKRRQKERMAA